MQNGNSLRKLAGIICLIFVVSEVGWYLTGRWGWVSSDLAQVGKDLLNIADNPAKYLAHIGFDIVYNLSIFLLGALFYLMFRKTNRALALFGGLGFLCTGFLWLFMDMSTLAQYHLAIDYANASGATASAIALRAADLSLAYDSSAPITSMFYAMGFISFGILIVRSGVLNRAIGWFAIVTGIVQLLFAWVGSFKGSVIGDYGYHITEAWFLVTGLWLVTRWVRGTSKQKPELEKN